MSIFGTIIGKIFGTTPAAGAYEALPVSFSTTNDDTRAAPATIGAPISRTMRVHARTSSSTYALTRVSMAVNSSGRAAMKNANVGIVTTLSPITAPTL